jgi:hypothetical protein
MTTIPDRASIDRVPLRTTDLAPTGSAVPASSLKCAETAERPRHTKYVAASDPRLAPKLLPRDIRALLFIGRGHEVAQYQLHEAVFTGLSEGIISRWVKRMVRREAIAVERWAKVGINRLRLTRVGLELLSDAGATTHDLFTPRMATALKDVQHTLWINDLRVVMARLPLPPDVVAPAWVLQRQIPTADAIPDLLAVRKPRGTDRGFVLACEIDLGAERLKGVFLPKLARLVAAVEGWAGTSPAAVLILTRGGRRAVAIREAIGTGVQVPMLVATLPAAAGREGLRELQRELEGAVATPTADRRT